MSSSAPAWIRLTKHHGLGNDFLVAIDPWRRVDGADAERWCHRREGIGADGLIQAVPVGATTVDAGGPSSRWRMDLWNSDGGRAEISGNGLRCLAQALADHRGHDRMDDLMLTIDTDAGPRDAVVVASPDQPSPEDRVRVTMGKAVAGPGPSDRWATFGVAVIDQVGVDLGNPHLVAFVDPTDDLARHDMATIGPAIEADHPGGLNVHVARVVDPDRIEMIIWERGAGTTMACGSGACAAAWAAIRSGLVAPGRGDIEVVMPGGSARVDVVDDEVVLTGPAVRVGEVRVDG